MKIKAKLKIWLIVILLIVIFAVLNFTGFSKDIKNFFFLISSPIQKSFWRAGKNISDFTSGILKINNLREEADILRLENKKLVGRIVALIETQKENEILKKALDLELEKDFELIFSQITNKDVFRDSVLIDKGSADGVSEGLPVISEQKIVLGRIGQVYDDFSEVILIFNKESSFDAKIISRIYFEENEKENQEQQPADIYGLVKGKGNAGLCFDLIPKEEKIFENDIIVTSALGGIYPSGLLVGEIEAIKKTDTSPFQEAEIKPAFNIEDLNYLFIIKKW